MLTTLGIIFSITLIAMVSPGPDMMLIIKNCGRSRRLPAVACIIGICAGLAFHVAFSILGIATIIATSSTIYSIVKIIGAAYLVYIGFLSLFSRSTLNFTKHLLGNEKNSVEDFMLPFKEGLFCNLLNPKVTIFILAIFTQVLDETTSSMHKMLYGCFIIIVVFIVWNLFVLLVRTKIILQFLERFQDQINRVAGIALIAFGVALLVESKY